MDWSRRHFLLGTVIGLGAGGVVLSKTETEIRTVEEDVSTTIEDFEDDLSSYGGDTEAASLQTSDVKEGDQTLLLDSDDVDVNHAYISDIDKTITQGSTYRFWVKTDGAGGYIYFTQDESSTPEGYYIRPNVISDTFELYRIDDGDFTGIADEPGLSLSEEWYEIEVSVSDGEHEGRLYDDSGTEIASLSATDDTYTSGGIGWRSYRGRMKADYLRLV